MNAFQKIKQQFDAGQNIWRRSSIAEVIKEIDAMSRWIPVEERLPTLPENRALSEYVIVLTDRHETRVAQYLHYGTAPYMWFLPDDEDPMLDTVTHWQPIPNPPRMPS